MKFTISTITLLVSAVTGAAVPVEGSVSPRANAITHLYLTTDYDWKFPSEEFRKNFEVRTNKCYNLDPPFQDAVSSAGPDKGVTCYLYEHFNCEGRSLRLVYPGYGNLGVYNFNDIASSFACL